LLIELLDLSETPEFAESQTSALVQMADFVAGADHAKYGLRQDSKYSELLEKQILVPERITWKALRAKWEDVE